MADLSTVLILQGGGALGAYQAGVYEQLHEKHTGVNWVIGTSIGAINAAIIAGNPPEDRVAKLRGFWQSLETWAPDTAAAWWLAYTPIASLSHSLNILGVLANGVKGFFKPRAGMSLDLNAKLPLRELGFYDTSPLKVTLEKYIDFDYLNSGVVRISICAVDIDTGQGVVFDSKNEQIEAEHIMASGALPPGFPPVVIGDKAYWDGGIYSNSPLSVFLGDDVQQDALCFLIDLWDSSESRPQSMAQALGRYKSIEYASRSQDQLAVHQALRDLQKAIRVLADKVPAAELKKKEIQALADLGRDYTINVVNLVMKAGPQDQYFRDIDFSAETIQARWQAGVHDCQRALKHKAWLLPLPPHAGLIIHELPQE